MQPVVLSKKRFDRVQFRNAGLMPSSRMTYLNAVKSYYRYLERHKLPDVFNIEVIRAWLAEYRTASSYNARLTVIREYYLKLHERSSAEKRLQIRESFESVRRMRPDHTQKAGMHYFSKKEIDMLSGKFTKRLSCIVMALFWTGCRISELLNIQHSDVTVGDPVSIRIIGKGMKERMVYLPLDEYRRIMATFQGKKWLIETMRGTQMSRHSVREQLRRQARRRCGIQKANAHLFRHSKAMYMKSLGLTPDQIARALGHTNVAVTLSFYMHGAPDAREQGIPRTKKIKEAV